MNMIFHSVDSQRYAALFANDATDVFIEARLMRFGYQWLAVFCRKDNVVEKVDV
jgi:hypothetical protein